VELQHWLVKFVAEVRQIDGIHPAHQICCCCGLGQALHVTGCTDVGQKFTKFKDAHMEQPKAIGTYIKKET